MSDDYPAFVFRAGGNGTHGSVRPATAETRERAICPKRLAKAVERPIKNVGPRQYVVKGNVEDKYFVDLSQDPPCLCRDVQHRSVRCLHTLAALLQERDPAVMAALVESYVNRGRRLREAGLEESDE